MAMNKKEIGEIAGLRRHMGVLVESLRSEIRVVAEQYGSIVNRLDRVDAKLVEHDARFDRIDLEFSAMKTGLFDTSHRVNDHETRIRKLEIAK
jgi:hypothetical protein